MQTIIHLIRHGHHALLGRVLCGRMPGVALDETGRDELVACATRLEAPPSIIQSSPQLRARQSAGILADHFGLDVKVVDEIDEIDLGDWTARSFTELENDPAWQQWNARRGSGRPPNGESMRSLQDRVVGHIERLPREQDSGPIVIVSHAEPIRAALMHYAGIALDDFLAVDIDPASVSTLVADAAGVHLSKVNQKVAA
jgi:broad specificity phosphatase PhoE